MRCPNCGANVRVGPVCERCGAALPTEGRQANVRVEGARQRAARRAVDREANAQNSNMPTGGAKRRGGTLGDFFNAQAQRQATRDRIPAAPPSPPSNQKERRSWLPIRTRLSSGPMRGNPAKRAVQPSALPQFPQYPAQSDSPPATQRQEHEATYEGYRQQAYDEQQIYDHSGPSQQQQAFSRAPRIEESPKPQSHVQAHSIYEQGYDQPQPTHSEYADAYTEQAPYDQRFDQDHQESQADIDDAWEAGYRAALGPGEGKGQRRGGRKDKPRRGGVNISAPDARAMREPAEDELRSPSQSWNIVGVPSASQHISGPLSGARHYVPMVPLEEIAAMPVHQGYSSDGRMYTPARPRPQQIVAGMSRLTANLLLLGVVLCILAIPAYIGIQRLPSLSPSPASTNTAQTTTVPTPQLARGFSGFLNDDFSMAYPSGWQHSASHVSSRAISFTGGQDVLVKVTTSDALPATELQQHLDEIAHGFDGVVPQVIASGQRKTYNKAVWLENDYVLTLVRGNKTVQIELRVLTIDYNANTYDLLLSAPRADYAQTNNSYFEPMLQSFRFQ